MNRAIQILGILASSLAIVSCSGANKLLEKGDYDGAIAKASKKYEKKQNAEHKTVLEQAYFEANELALNEIERNIILNTEESWNRVYRLTLDVERRNNKFNYLLAKFPELTITKTEVALFKYYALSKANEHAMENIIQLKNEGNEAQWENIFEMVNAMETRNKQLVNASSMFPEEQFIIPATDELMDEAVQRATDYAFNDAMLDLFFGRDGNIAAARRAYDKFENSKRFGIIKERVSALRAESKTLGTSQVYIDVIERGRDDITYSIYRDLENLFRNNLNTTWVEFVNRSSSDVDYTIEVDIDEFDISQEREREVSQNFNRTIRDFRRNSNGQYILDSLGNRIPIDVIISGQVTTVERTKRARIDIEYRIINEHNNRSIERDSFTDEYVFRSFTYRRNGDERAIPNEFKNNVPRLQRFPSDREMTKDLMNDLEVDFRNELRRVRL